MSAIIKSSGGSLLDNIFIFYDFSQVKDAVLVVTYFENLGRWEKIIVFYINNSWETESLMMQLSSKKYKWLCEKLLLIFQQPNVEASKSLCNDIKQESDFILTLNGVNVPDNLHKG